MLSGGAGTRLWPLSRADDPKQFQNLGGNAGLLDLTLRRMKDRETGRTPINIIAGASHREKIEASAAGYDLAGGRLIYEPVGRNTAAAVAMACLDTLASFGDELVLIVPSDHDISTSAQFWDSVHNGVEAALSGQIILFGVQPKHPETGYGYVEVGENGRGVLKVERFVEKPDAELAASFVASGRHFWNAGIFLFKASTMQGIFQTLRPDIWDVAERAYRDATTDGTARYLPIEIYADMPSISLDYAIMEHAGSISLVPVSFDWTDLGSWQSVFQSSSADPDGNVIVGDVVAVDCRDSYLRSDGRLLTVVGAEGLAVISTSDAAFVAPLKRSEQVRSVVDRLKVMGRRESIIARTELALPGSWRDRVRYWLFEEALPLWSTLGVDRANGGFHEALGFSGLSINAPKRMRTMARQIYVFAFAKMQGWTGPADELVEHGLSFISSRRTLRGGWVRSLRSDGTILDATENIYDHACVLLALAYAHAAGNQSAHGLMVETFAFIDTHLTGDLSGGYFETAHWPKERCSNSHMHLLEAFLACYQVTADTDMLRRARNIVQLFSTHFFDADSDTLGEFFDEAWQPATGTRGSWTEPGHQFEWASLLIEYAMLTGETDLVRYARKLYASALAFGRNRHTGLVYGAVSRSGEVLGPVSRSWPQIEALRATIALNGSVSSMNSAVEDKVARLFTWHIDPAPAGMWIDSIDARGKSISTHVPASILYHLIGALTRYLDANDPGKGPRL